MRSHRKTEASKAFVSADIERLKFVSQHATFNDKDHLLLETLKGKAEILKSSQLSALYNFEIASLYQQLGNRYNNNPNEGEVDEAYRWKLKEALELCNSVISTFPKSSGAQKCEILKQQILQSRLQIQAEQFIPVNSPSRVLVTYKNLTDLDFKIYKVSQRQLEKFNNRYRVDEKINFFKNLSASKTFSSSLKSEGDYQNHSTEIVIPKLPNGLYLIKADTNSKENVFAVAHIQVTDLALIESNENTTIDYQLISRNNGKPIVDAKVNVSYRNNRNKTFSKSLLQIVMVSFGSQKTKTITEM